MRLIDADALIKRFEGLRDEHETLAISYVALYEVLVATPTAYNVDAVVEHLKECSDEYKNSSCEYEQGKSFAYGNAIDIVRNAGKDLRNE